MISKEDLVFALEHSAPPDSAYNFEYMADNLLLFCNIEKNPDHIIWQPEPEPGTGPETPPGSPPPPHND